MKKALKSRKGICWNLDGGTLNLDGGTLTLHGGTHPPYNLSTDTIYCILYLGEKVKYYTNTNSVMLPWAYKTNHDNKNGTFYFLGLFVTFDDYYRKIVVESWIGRDPTGSALKNLEFME